MPRGTTTGTHTPFRAASLEKIRCGGHARCASPRGEPHPDSFVSKGMDVRIVPKQRQRRSCTSASAKKRCVLVCDDIHVACLTFNFARIRCPLFPRSGSLNSMPMHSTFLSAAHSLRQMESSIVSQPQPPFFPLISNTPDFRM